MIRVMIFGFCVNYDKNLRGLNEMALILHVMNAKYCMIDNNLFLVKHFNVINLISKVLNY